MRFEYYIILKFHVFYKLNIFENLINFCKYLVHISCLEMCTAHSISSLLSVTVSSLPLFLY